MGHDDLDVDVTDAHRYFDHHLTPLGDSEVFAPSLAGPLTGTQPPVMGRRSGPRSHLPDLRRRTALAATTPRRVRGRHRRFPWGWFAIGVTGIGLVGAALLAAIVLFSPRPPPPAREAPLVEVAPPAARPGEVGGR